MIHCASFEGTNADQLALPPSFLHHQAAAAPDASAVRARPSRYIEMNRIAKKTMDTRRPCGHCHH
jgi:hypothetical protein